MSTPDAFSQHNTPHGRGGVVVDRPGVVQSIGYTLNRAFGEEDGLPDDMAMLLSQLNDVDQSAAR